MIILKSTAELSKNIWNKDLVASNLPKRYEWLKSNSPKFSDIDLWEEVYKQPGNFGVYAAWSPYVEFYIIVLFLFNDMIIEQYTNLDQIVTRTNELGVDLAVSKIWVSN